MTALHRSEIGEVWIQPSLLKEAPKLFLVPPPTSNLKLLVASGVNPVMLSTMVTVLKDKKSSLKRAV